MAAWTDTLELIRRDLARWVRPEQVAALDEVTPGVACRLVLRHPPVRALLLFRLGALAHQLGVRGIPGWVQRRMLVRYGIEIAPSTPVGGGLYVPHPVGCVLHARSIGENVSIIGNATFGTRTDAEWPVIGDRSFVGVGARILGGITIGHDAVVGANAVVLSDVPAGHVAIGVPAVARARRSEPASSR